MDRDASTSGDVPRARLMPALVAGIALVAIAIAAASYTPARRALERYRLERRVTAIVGAANELPYRVTEARLSGGFAHRPLRPAQRGATEDATRDRWKVLRAVSELESFDARHEPQALHALAAGDLLLGNDIRAIDRLEARLERDAALGERIERASDARLLSDLSAAYYQSATVRQRPIDLLSAVAAAARASRLEPRNVEAAWNRALAIEAIGLLDESREAWRDYLALDPSSDWSAEARTRLGALMQPSDSEEWRSAAAELERAATQWETATVERIAARFPVRTRSIVETQWIQKWADAASHDDVNATRLLAMITAAGAGVSRTAGDFFLADFANAARAATDVNAFAAPHARLAAVRDIRRTRGTPAAIEELNKIFPELDRVQSPSAVAVLIGIASMHYTSDQHVEALRQLDRAEGMFDPRRWPLTGAASAWARGVALTSLGHTRRGAAAYEQSLAIFERCGDRLNSGMLQVLLADNAELTGNSDRAWKRYIDAVRLIERHGEVPRAVNVLDSVSRAALRFDQHGFASLIADALTRRAAEPRYAQYRCHALITRCEIESRAGRASEAAAECRAAREVWSGLPDAAERDRLQTDLEVAEAASATGAARVEILTRAVDVAADRRDLFRLSRVLLLRSRAYAEAAAARLARADLEKALASIEEQRQRLDVLSDRLTYFETSRGVSADLVRVLVRTNEPVEALRVVERARARVLVDRLTASSPRGAIPIDDIRRQLDDDHAIVEWWADENELFIWVIRRDGVTFAREPIARAKLGDAARRYVAAMEAGEASERDRVLYAHLIKPVARAIADAGTLTLIPDPAITRVPFAALRDETGKYLIERYALTFSASATAFAATPSLPQRSSVLVVASPQSLEPLLPLDTRREIAAASSAMPRTVVIRGADATAGALLHEAGKYDAVHLAMHAFEDDTRGEPVLAMTPEPGREKGLLAASEIESVMLRKGALVILAACRTAAGRTSAEGTLSLARAFAAAGAGSVIATLWDADDADAAFVFSHFYASLAANATPAASLRAAQIALLKTAGPTGVRRWAVYQIYGGA